METHRTDMFYPSDEGLRHACGLTLQAITRHAPDILKRHAARALPMAYFAMHEKKTSGRSRRILRGDCFSGKSSLVLLTDTTRERFS